jgi:hypothetical protein
MNILIKKLGEDIYFVNAGENGNLLIKRISIVEHAPDIYPMHHSMKPVSVESVPLTFSEVEKVYNDSEKPTLGDLERGVSSLS